MDRIAFISQLKERLYSIRHRYLLFLEKRRGLDIRQAEYIAEVHQDLAQNFRYSTAGQSILKRVFKTLPIRADDALLDIGSGKGGVLVALSKYPFRKLGGIELSPKLHAIAQNNMTRLGIKHVELFCCNAAEFTALDDYTYLYFFNPFSCAVMEAVMQNVLASLHSHPRKLTIIYNNPLCHETILKTGIFVKTAEFQRKDYAPCTIYQNIPM